jgi:hypothetical protein
MLVFGVGVMRSGVGAWRWDGGVVHTVRVIWGAILEIGGCIRGE